MLRKATEIGTTLLRPTEDELVRVLADADPDTNLFLHRTRLGKGESDDGDADARGYGAHIRCIGRSVQKG